MSIPFVKYSGSGNDFIIIDNRCNICADSLFPLSIRQLCHRHFGVGADGVILLENSIKNLDHFRMRIFNADGTEAEMCGNGIRCLAHFIRNLLNLNGVFTIETMLQHVRLDVNDNMVTVFMPLPTANRYHLSLVIEGKSRIFHFLNTGVPHVVHFVDDIEDETLMAWAPAIRFHSEFAPKGTNVNFAKIQSDGTVAMRTYERGVEGETLSCGTGTIAVAFTASQLYGVKSPVYVRTRSQELLQVIFDPQWDHVFLQGAVVNVFTGCIRLY